MHAAADLAARSQADSQQTPLTPCVLQVDGARQMLNQLLADVYIFTDHVAGPEAGLSPGYGIMLVAETTAKTFLSAEAAVAADAMVRSMHHVLQHVALQSVMDMGMDMGLDRQDVAPPPWSQVMSKSPSRRARRRLCQRRWAAAQPNSCLRRSAAAEPWTARTRCTACT